MPRLVIRLWKVLFISSLLSACHHTPKSPGGPPAPTTIKTGIKPPSITIQAGSGWTAAPVARGTPLFTDNYYSVQFYPPALQGAILIQRPESVATAGGYLDGNVTVPAPAMLYMALLCENNDIRLVPDNQLNALAGDGWTRVPGIFSSSEPESQHWYWAVYSHPVPVGAVIVKSEAIEHPSAVFIIGKLR